MNFFLNILLACFHTFHFGSRKFHIPNWQYFVFFLNLREKPHDTDWKALNNLKLPLLLNFAQCKLLKNEFYEVIEHSSEVLKFEPGIYKAINLN